MSHTPAAPPLPLLSRASGETLIDQIVRSVAARIDDKLLRGGARMPSIRQFAASLQVSCATVVASYDKLVARDYLESRRGAGFFVRERSPLNTAVPLAPGATEQAGAQKFDVVWLIRNMFRRRRPTRRPVPACCRPNGSMANWWRAPCATSAASQARTCSATAPRRASCLCGNSCR